MAHLRLISGEAPLWSARSRGGVREGSPGDRITDLSHPGDHSLALAAVLKHEMQL